jgi:hypothetical protein
MRRPELPRHDAVVRVEKIGQAWRARASLFFAGVPGRFCSLPYSGSFRASFTLVHHLPRRHTCIKL